MTLLRIFLYSLTFVLFFGCSTSKLMEGPVITESVLLDTLRVTASPITAENKYSFPTYNPSQTRFFDLINTSLDLSFDIPNSKVNGVAILTIKPLIEPQSEILLDAKGFTIHSIKDANGNSLKYDYDQSILTIKLEKPWPVSLMDDIVIKYTADPSKDANRLSGAIQSNQGLYFINPSGQSNGLPTQIWSQGETEYNSRWFPTFDQPNENSLQSIKLTVPEQFQTLSNGLMSSSIDNRDGTRTDTWSMTQPHAPYLFMIAVGEFAMVEELWRGRPIQYFVEKDYAASAKVIFNNTVEMLDFYSDLFGVEYPWEKYAQIIVRQFVSGAMENTTAVIFGDFIQMHQADMLTEYENDYIVAHELIHHWFGDLVTCESWANLTLNEGFANYGEYLWFEHKYGRDEADLSRLYEKAGYFGEAATRRHPLIHYGYDDMEEMFDAHSYNKGGLVLHMLRHYLGDDLFFKACQLYLERNAYQSVEVHDLRIAFEDATGMDLNWFFDQWYLSSGHPVMEINYSYDVEKSMLSIEIEQVQDPVEFPAVFQFPFQVDILMKNGEINTENLYVNKRLQTFDIRLKDEPTLLIPNSDDVALGYFKMTFSVGQNTLRLKHSKSLWHRLEALQSLIEQEELTTEVIADALADPHWSIRNNVLDNIDAKQIDIASEKIAQMVQKDPDNRVKLSAMDALADINHRDVPRLAEIWFDSETKTDLIRAAYDAWSSIDKKGATEAVKKYGIVLED